MTVRELIAALLVIAEDPIDLDSDVNIRTPEGDMPITEVTGLEDGTVILDIQEKEGTEE